jgi:hypothetical protein
MDEEVTKKFEEMDERLKRLEQFFQKNADILPSKDIWDIDSDQLTLLKFVGNTTQEKTKNIALLVLLGYKKKLSKEKVLSSEIKRNVGLNGVPTDNFGTYLKEMIPQLILRVGNAKSNKLAYRLTAYGESKAKELLEGC